MFSGKSIKVLFARKLNNGDFATYGVPIPKNTLKEFREKTEQNIKNGIYFSISKDYEDFLSMDAYGVYKVSELIDNEEGIYMVIKFECTDPAEIMYKWFGNENKIVKLKWVGSVSTMECYSDQYLQKSINFKFVKWLRKNFSSVEKYYEKQRYFQIIK